MLIWNLELLSRDPLLFLILMATVFVALLVVLTFHEFSHGWVANHLGDDTAQRQGRLSLNPLAHLDPMGTIMIVLVGIGWGKPVPIDPSRLRTDPRTGMAMVAAAGPLSNLVLAGLFSLPFRFGLLDFCALSAFPVSDISLPGVFNLFILYVVLLDIILAIFNLIPIAPLDGFRVLVGILPRNWGVSLSNMERYGPIILLMVIGIGLFTGFLGNALSAAVNLFFNVFIGSELL